MLASAVVNTGLLRPLLLVWSLLRCSLGWSISLRDWCGNMLASLTTFGYLYAFLLLATSCSLLGLARPYCTTVLAVLLLARLPSTFLRAALQLAVPGMVSVAVLFDHL